MFILKYFSGHIIRNPSLNLCLILKLKFVIIIIDITNYLCKFIPYLGAFLELYNSRKRVKRKEMTNLLLSNL